MEPQGSGGVRLTGAGRFLLFLVGLAVLGFAAYTYRDQLFKKSPASSPSTSSPKSTPSSSSTPSSGASSASTPRTGVLGRIKQSGVMRVGMEPDAPPLHFLNDKKQEDGFDFRLAGKVAEAIGARRIEVVEADYEDLPGKLRNGDIDVIMAGYVPDPTVEGVVWSNGYLDFGLCMVVHESMASTYKSPSDLAGKRVAIYDDPAAERWVKENIPNAKIQKFSGDSGWFEAVEKDQAR